MRRVWLVAAVLALVGAVGPAQAQSGSAVQLFGFPGGEVISQTSIRVQTSGQLVVSFHGDAAAGCAAYGLCSYSGTVVVRPSGGDLTILTLRDRGRITHAAFLGLGLGVGPGPGSPGYATSTRVQRSIPGSPAATCADARSALFSSIQIGQSRAGSFAIRVLAPGGSLLQTRCAGPADGDLAAVSPAVKLPVARLLRGRIALDLTGTRSFAVHGFAGMLSSTLVLHLGRPQRQFSAGTSFPPGIKTELIRNVSERLTPVRIDGQLSAAVDPTPDPIVCRVLDSCGLTGTLSLTPLAGEASAYVIASGPASRPDRDFLTALGLQRSGRARGISVAVLLNFVGDVRADVSQAGVTCTDTASTGGVAVVSGSVFGTPAVSGALLNSWRTRCPGPILGSAQTGVSPSIPKLSLGRRQFTITLRGHGSFSDDGYVIAPQGRLAVVVRWGRITQQVIRTPMS